jgi:hypothetical protein
MRGSSYQVLESYHECRLAKFNGNILSQTQSSVLVAVKADICVSTPSAIRSDDSSWIEYLANDVRLGCPYDRGLHRPSLTS